MKEKLAEQFNRRHGAHPKKFRKEEPVYVRMYRNNSVEWVVGRVIGRSGSIIYKVKVGDKILKRHANQVRQRPTEDALRCFMESFDLPAKATTTHQEEEQVESQKTKKSRPRPSPRTHTPIQRPRRIRRLPTRYQVRGISLRGEVL